MYAFNARINGKPAILGHVYGLDPVPTSFTIPFELRPASKGTYGLFLTTSFPGVVSAGGYVTGLSLKLGREFSARGKAQSYLSAGCPAPKGVPRASFKFAHAEFSFSGGKTIRSTLYAQLSGARLEAALRGKGSCSIDLEHLRRALSSAWPGAACAVTLAACGGDDKGTTESTTAGGTPTSGMIAQDGSGASFKAPGGDNGIEEFGKEAAGSDLRQAEEAVAALFRAVESSDWSEVCGRYLSNKMSTHSRRSPELNPHIEGCLLSRNARQARLHRGKADCAGERRRGRSPRRR